MIKSFLYERIKKYSNFNLILNLIFINYDVWLDKTSF